MTRIGLSMVVFYDASNTVIATLESMLARDADGNVLGLIDFEAHELAGGAMTDIKDMPGAVGAKTWPEWVDARGFRVEKEGDPGRRRLTALVHPSGHRRERAPIEAEVARRIEISRRESGRLQLSMAKHLRSEGAERDEADELASRIEPAPTDLRDLLGGPGRPLLLDDRGRTRRVALKGSPGHLPLLRGGRVDEPEDAGAQPESNGAP